MLTVETLPWAERRHSGELPLAFLARVERLPFRSPPSANAPTISTPRPTGSSASSPRELGADLELSDDALAHLRRHPSPKATAENSATSSNAPSYSHYRETEVLEWSHLAPFLTSELRTPATPPASPRPRPLLSPTPARP